MIMVGDVNNDLGGEGGKDEEKSCSAKEIHRNWRVQTENSVQLVNTFKPRYYEERKKERYK